MTAAAIQVDMKTLQALLAAYTPDIAVCIRGPHAVGKSEGTYQAATRMRSDFYKDEKNQKKYSWSYEQGLPVVERRLSQMTEGDMIGMPELTGHKSTTFRPLDWLIDATERPVVLFLDERNRALEGVKQAVFQLMDSRAFYGYKLHPETRVIIAENVGDLYQVQQLDPAEVSRAATVELCPTVEEWISYASTRCNPMITQFIQAHPEWLEFKPGGEGKNRKVYESLKKYPDRRSWFKLAQQLAAGNFFENPKSELFYQLSASMVGVEAALNFAEFARNYSFQVTAKDILANWQIAKAKLLANEVITENAQTKYLDLANQIVVFIKDKTLTEQQAKQIGCFLNDCPPEITMKTWTLLGSHKSFFEVHKHIETKMVELATGEVYQKQSK